MSLFTYGARTTNDLREYREREDSAAAMERRDQQRERFGEPAAPVVVAIPYGDERAEYRRGDCSVAMGLECRLVQADGTPYDGHQYWERISANHWVWLQRNHPHVLATLLPASSGSSTLTPRG
jgi:hypothetical protein